MSQQERDEVANRSKCASKKAQCKVRKQVERSYQGQVYQYVPPCEAPLANEAFEQTVVSQPNQIDAELQEPLIVEETL